MTELRNIAWKKKQEAQKLINRLITVEKNKNTNTSDLF